MTLIQRGDKVEILGNGRKTHVDRRTGIETKPVRGDTGVVLWIGTGFGGERRLGIKVDRTGGMIFTGMAVRRVYDPAPVEADEGEPRESNAEAHERAHREGYVDARMCQGVGCPFGDA